MNRVLHDGGVGPRRSPQPGEPVDRSVQLADTRTDLALQRSAMAADRTLMAWIRTALSMISFGFTMGKLADALGPARVDLLFGRTTDIGGISYYLVILGTLALILAAAQYSFEMAAFVREGLTRRVSLPLLIAVLLSVLGLWVFAD